MVCCRVGTNRAAEFLGDGEQSLPRIGAWTEQDGEQSLHRVGAWTEEFARGWPTDRAAELNGYVQWVYISKYMLTGWGIVHNNWDTKSMVYSLTKWRNHPQHIGEVLFCVMHKQWNKRAISGFL